MHNKIKQELAQLEEERDITILLACETGSRAWGFPSPDSDYDIRMIYKRPRDWYLSLNEGKDTIELMLEDGELDITGWDIRKTLRLLWKSNAALLERLQSPIVYMQVTGFMQAIMPLAKSRYSRIAVMYHYLSMAKKVFAEVEDQDQYKLKKLFYALRTATACIWIIERDEIPPIVYTDMLNGLDLATSLTDRIHELIALKATKNESYLHTGEKELLHFIREDY